MTDLFDLPHGPDGFLDMEAFDDAELAPDDAAGLDEALAGAGSTDLDDDTWSGLVEHAVDPTAPEVDDDIVGDDHPFAALAEHGPSSLFGGLGDDDDIGADDATATTGGDDPVAPHDDDDADTATDTDTDDDGDTDPDVDLPDGFDELDPVIGSDPFGLDDDLGPVPDDGTPVDGHLDDAPVDDVDALDAFDGHLGDHGL